MVLSPRIDEILFTFGCTDTPALMQDRAVDSLNRRNRREVSVATFTKFVKMRPLSSFLGRLWWSGQGSRPVTGGLLGRAPSPANSVIVSLGKTLNLPCLLIVVGGAGAWQPYLCHQCVNGCNIKHFGVLMGLDKSLYKFSLFTIS